MAQFALDALSARKGDALVLRWGDANDSHLALIDGGPSSVYDTAIRPHLQALAGTDPAGRSMPVVLRLVVVSHVDDDHIQGVIDLANAIETARKRAEPEPARITEAWHNSFADMQFLADFNDQPELRKAIVQLDARPAALEDPSVAPRDATPSQLTAGAQSVAQGRQLDRVLGLLRVPRNHAFADRGSFVRDGADVSVEGLRVTVLAPNTGLLGRLKTLWKAELERILKTQIDKQKAGVAALAAAFDDPSIPNQSSIVLLVEFGGKRMLLSGDARGDHIIAALKASPAVTKLPLEVDLFKVPHHGSAHSNGVKLFEAVKADHYVISGNGEHGNPHADALQALLNTERGRPITIHLTNRPTAGATKPLDVKKAKAAQKILDAVASDPSVTVIYRRDGDLAVSVELL